MRDDVLDEKMQSLEDSEMELAEDMRPDVEFSPSTVRSVMKSMNKLIDVFDQPKVDESIFPETLELFVRSIHDAVEAGVLDEQFDCTPPVSDVDLKYLAGKLELLAKPKNKKAFARFLEEAPPAMEEPIVETTPEPAEQNPVLRALR